MSLDRANLKYGPAKMTWNSATFFTKDDLITPFKPDYKDVMTAMHGKVDKVAVNRVIKIPFTLWGAWENLSKLFPSVVLTPTIGYRIFGTSDLPLVIHSRNQDRLTVHNVQLTKLTDLFLGVQDTIFAAGEFTGLIKNSANPEDSAAYFTLDTAAYTDATFAKTNFKQQRYGAVWGTNSGFTSFQAKEGWRIAWSMDLEPEDVDGLGTVDYKLLNFSGQARAIPIEPTAANIVSGAAFQGTALGGLLSAGASDLVITGSGVSVSLLNAAIIESGFAWGARPLRNGEIAWETTVGFSAGVAGARAALS